MNRLLLRIALIVVVAGGIVGYRILFVDTDEVIGFNDTVVDVVEKADAGFHPFVAELEKYSEGGSVDVEMLTQIRDSLESNLTRNRNRLQSVEIPEDEICQGFHAACVAYVDNSMTIAEKYKEVIEYISAHNPGDKENSDAVDELLDDLITKDQELLQAIGQHQEKMAKEFDIKLE